MYIWDENTKTIIMDMKKSSTTPHVAERKMSWDSQNRLRGLNDNGYASLYWYDADGNRTVKEHLLRKKLGFYRLIVTK